MSPRSSRKFVFVSAALAFVMGSAAAATVPQESLSPAIEQGERLPTMPVDGTPLNYGDGHLKAEGSRTPLAEAIEKVVSAPGMGAIAEMTVRDAPEEALYSGVPWLAIRVEQGQFEDAGQARAGWLAAIARGAVTDLHRGDEQAANEVIGGATVEVLAFGSKYELFGATGYVATGQVFSSEGASDETIIERAEATLRSFDLRPFEVEVLRPLGAAIRIRAVVPTDNRVKWTIDDLRNALVGSPASLEGVFIELEGPDGRPLLAAGASYRTGFGSLWFAEGEDVRFGALHGHSPAASD